MKFTSTLLLAGSVSAFTNNKNSAKRAQTVELSLFGTDQDGENMSKALPFAPRPKLLDGTMAGDVGFE